MIPSRKAERNFIQNSAWAKDRHATSGTLIKSMETIDSAAHPKSTTAQCTKLNCTIPQLLAPGEGTKATCST
jgi:hypothetical protein